MVNRHLFSPIPQNNSPQPPGSIAMAHFHPLQQLQTTNKPAAPKPDSMQKNIKYIWGPALFFLPYPACGGGKKKQGAGLYAVIGQQSVSFFKAAALAKLLLSIPGPAPPPALSFPYAVQ